MHLSSFRKAAATLAKHPTKLTSGNEAKKLVNVDNIIISPQSI